MIGNDSAKLDLSHHNTCVFVGSSDSPKGQLQGAITGAQLSWLWEYKRKQRIIPKKEREKEKKEGFPSLLEHLLFVKFFENHHQIY